AEHSSLVLLRHQLSIVSLPLGSRQPCQPRKLQCLADRWYRQVRWYLRQLSRALEKVRPLLYHRLGMLPGPVLWQLQQRVSDVTKALDPARLVHWMPSAQHPYLVPPFLVSLRLEDEVADRDDHHVR